MTGNSFSSTSVLWSATRHGIVPEHGGRKPDSYKKSWLGYRIDQQPTSGYLQQSDAFVAIEKSALFYVNLLVEGFQKMVGKV